LRAVVACCAHAQRNHQFLFWAPAIRISRQSGSAADGNTGTTLAVDNVDAIQTVVVSVYLSCEQIAILATYKREPVPVLL
jgi:hypothetical protein